MESRTITIPVVLGEKSFRRFALYDALIVQRRWRRPAAFSGILLAFAVAALLTRREQSGLIAAVLLTVGIGLPLVWIGAFLSQINLQVIRNRLKPPRAVYRVLLSDSGITVTGAGGGETLEYPWEKVYGVRRCGKDLYLYAAKNRAFLLPDGQADAPAGELTRFLKEHLGNRCSV